MRIQLTKFLGSVSFALDYVERELVQAILKNATSEDSGIVLGDAAQSMLLEVAPYHAKRVAVLTNRMAVALSMDEEAAYALTHAALLHDCALSEYIDGFAKINAGNYGEAMKPHCLAGEEIVSGLPFYEHIRSCVLYHHERADGMGPFGKSPEETPLGAQLIHLADELDVRFSLNQMDEQKAQEVRAYVLQQKGRLYSAACADAFLEAIDYQLLASIAGEESTQALARLIPSREMELSVEMLRKMSFIFADITDYKSQFTWRHSIGIAEKAEAMGRYYGHPAETCDKLYIAGALHDVGKLFISNDILEKPGRLTKDEYQEIQNHAQGTWRLLSGIGGMEDITSWAANHHEKLDGSGYPYGKTADELGPNERLLACLDIYQALVEERPYKPGLAHEEAMEILDKMGSAGQLDTGILADIDRCFSGAAPATRPAKQPQEEVPEYTDEVWRCPVCGYIYEGKLPDDFICPRCEQPGSIFERIN